MPFQFGKILVALGVILVAAGLALMFGARISFFNFGRLPGDIVYKGKHGSFYFPIASCIILSGLLTLVLWVISVFMKK